MKTALINNEVVEFDLSGRSEKSYEDWGDRVTYLGTGVMKSNEKGPVLGKSELTHFWKIN